MHQIVHPLSRAIYEAVALDLIKVTKDGREGFYTRDGEYLSGPLKQSVDPEMCRWVASYMEHKHAGVGTSARDRAGSFAALKDDQQ
ncbi:MAG: hypothetical protein RJB08_311 [Actinomycetota bacterium]|jgi:hypothetical protein